MKTRAYTDALEAALGRIVADALRQVETIAARSDAVVATMQARVAELETRNAALEVELRGRVDKRLEQVHDGEPGKDADPEVVARLVADAIEARLSALETRDVAAEIMPAINAMARTIDALPPPPEVPDLAGMVAEAVGAAVAAIPAPELPDVSHMVDEAVRAAVDALPPPVPGKDADPAEVARMVAEAVAALPPPAPGKDADPADVARMVEEAVAAIPPAKDGKDADPAEIARMVAFAVADLPAPKDGKDADPAEIARMVAEAVASLPPAEPGKDADPAEVARMVAEAVADIPAPKDGQDVDPEEIRRMVAEAVAELPPPVPGKDADPAEVERMVTEAVRAAVAAIPAPEIPDVAEMVDGAVARAVAAIPPAKDGEPGKDADPAEVAALRDEIGEVRAAVAGIVIPEPPDLSGFALRSEIPVIPDPPDFGPEIEAVARQVEEVRAEAIERINRHPGVFPVVKEWTDTVHYEGAVVGHDGATWQAIKDTGRAPPHADWICLAAQGAKGDRGDSIEVRGTYSPDATYRKLDVVALDGSFFMARSDDPGPCPGDGWQLACSRGGRGKPGEKGDPGRPGEPGISLADVSVDDEGVLTLMLGDGSEFRADFYPVLTKVARA